MITHYDLFAGIGGFSLALEEVFNEEEIRHIFCEWEQFPTAVLKHHWPQGEYWGDIANLVADTKRERLERGSQEGTGYTGQRNREGTDQNKDWSILTGGFPCQPFSQAGRRKGTADDRYQWPNMLEVIRNVKPKWVIAENVRGLVTWNEGLVLETVCSDLEAEGYEVQPFIIPANAKGAPHKRDRVWIIANTSSSADSGTVERVNGKENGLSQEHRQERSGSRESSGTNQLGFKGTGDGLQDSGSVQGRTYPDWSRDWREVAFATCDDSVADGLSRKVDGVSYSRSKWRQQSLKAYGNAIVPQVAMEIMKAIKEANKV